MSPESRLLFAYLSHVIVVFVQCLKAGQHSGVQVKPPKRTCKMSRKTNMKGNDIPIEIWFHAAPVSIQTAVRLQTQSLKDEPKLDSGKQTRDEETEMNAGCSLSLKLLQVTFPQVIVKCAAHIKSRKLLLSVRNGCTAVSIQSILISGVF